MHNAIFTVAIDEEHGGWFIWEPGTHHILNADEVAGDEYKSLFVKGIANDMPLTTFEMREAAYKVLDNLDTIYIGK